jgi:hypothetical protein
MRNRTRQVEGSPRLTEALHQALMRGQGGAELDVTGAGVAFDFSGRAIADSKAVIRDTLAPFDAIQTLGSIVAFSVFSPAEIYSEPTSVPSSRVEYVASVLLERDDPAGLRVMTTEQTNRAAGAIQRALDAADEIGRNTIFSLLSRSTRSVDPMRRIAAHLQLQDAGIRGPGYEHQTKGLIADLFTGVELDAALTRILGFTADQAVALEDTVSRLARERMNGTLRMLRLIANQAQQAAFQLQRQGEQILSFTAEDLAEAAAVPAEAAAAFFERFSVGFGEGEHVHLLTGLSPIRRRPFVRTPDGRHLLTSPVNLVWSLEPALENALKDEPEWETYQQRRAAWVEAKVVDALNDALRADAHFANLRYSSDGGDLFEIDGVVIVDDVCFVLEAKAGRLSDQARRGRVRALRPELERLVGRGSSQAVRLRNAILTGRNISFIDTQGSAVEVPLEAVENVEAVVVTLEDFGWLLGLREEMLAAGLASAADEIPWIVSVFDFELVCHLLEFPAQLTLYLKDRRALPNTISGGDEMNLWMMHMLNKLEFPAGAGRISLRGDWTEDIDRHFMFGHGALPRMPLERAARREVERLDRERPRGHIRQAEDVVARDQGTRRPEPAISLRRGEVTISVYAKNSKGSNPLPANPLSATRSESTVPSQCA